MQVQERGLGCGGGSAYGPIRRDAKIWQAIDKDIHHRKAGRGWKRATIYHKKVGWEEDENGL
jgi:hypothetical protein